MPINSKVSTMPRIPETEQSEYYFLLLPLAILANLSICTQAEFNQKKKLKSTRKETLRILESWWKKQSGKTTKSPYRNGWSTSGSVARTSRLCRRSPSGDDSMNAAFEALGDCPLLEEDRTSSFEGWSAIPSLAAAAAAAASTNTNSPSRDDEATSSSFEFYNDFAAI